MEVRRSRHCHRVRRGALSAVRRGALELLAIGMAQAGGSESTLNVSQGTPVPFGALHLLAYTMTASWNEGVVPTATVVTYVFLPQHTAP